MIKTSEQLKALIRNLAKKNAADAQLLMRNYMMERFLERISISDYRDKFILKGGMLIAAMVGLNARSTMDIDATVKGAIHTTEMGIDRIKRNLKIDAADIVEYCINKISDKNCHIYKQGKNLYCEVENIKITINSRSYTIITAHIIK